MRKAFALALILAATAIAGAFTLLTAVCGRMVVEAVEPGEAQDEPRCEPALHPMGPVFTVFSLVALVAAWMGLRWPVLAMGAALTGLGALFGFSMGLFGIGAGLLVVAGALVLPPNH